MLTVYSPRLVISLGYLRESLLVVLRIYVTSAVFQPYRDLEAGNNQSFIPKTSKDWNSLPESARIVQSLGEFRRFLDKDKIIVPNYYYFGQRKSQVIHTCLRLNCNSLGSDLLNNHISENANCLFCNVPETVEHYLLHCNN